MKIWEQVQSSRSLILVNLIALVSALIWGLDVRFFLLFYWLESGVAGIFNILKMVSVKDPESASFLKLFLVPFFMVHYGIFMAVHLIFLLSFIGQFDSKVGAISYVIDNIWVFVINMILLVSEYVTSFHIWRNTTEDTSVVALMFQPYGRIVAMHLTLLFGAFLFYTLDSGKVFLILLMILKTSADLVVKK
jgi:hypothetical protein